MQLDEADYADAYLDDKPEYLPGGWLIDRGEAKKLHKGAESVKILTPDARDKIEVDIDLEGYVHYFGIWEKWHYLNMLPNVVGGWVDELPWILDVVIMFEKLNNELAAHRASKKD